MTQERSFPGPISVRWTWVDWVYCLFVIPVAVFLLLWWGVTDWLEHFWIFAVPAFAVLMLFLWVVAGIAFRFLRCYWPQPRPMPWWHGPLWATLPLLIVAWIWIERHDDRPGLWLDRQMWAQGLFFEFETSLTGDGEDVHIRRLIECVGYGPGLGQAPGFERPLYLGIKQYATPQSVGQRLAAGGAVMLVVQDVCDDLVRWASDTPGAREGTIAYPLPDDDLPLIAWTPNPGRSGDDRGIRDAQLLSAPRCPRPIPRSRHPLRHAEQRSA